MLRKASPLLLLLVVVFAAVNAPLPASAVDCSGVPGTHPAAANEVPGVAAGTCVGGNTTTTLLNGGCDTNPYPELEKYKNGGNVEITPSGGPGNGTSDLRNGINPALACRLLKFFQYAQQTKGCVFKINSAYRSAQLQRQLCGNGRQNCAPPGTSCHQYGLAVDVTSSSQCMSWATSFLGIQNPGSPGAQQFKLHFPVRTDLVHIQCIENMVGGCSASTKPCDGSVRITPDLTFTPTTGLPFDQSLRQALGVPPPPPPPPAQSAVTPISQPTQSTQSQTGTTATPPSIDTLNSTPYPAGTCTPQTYCSKSDGNIYYRATTCVDQKYQTCPSGCTGLICNATSTTSSNSPLSDLLSPTGDTQSTDSSSDSNTSSGTSTFDLIDFFANPVSNTAADIGTSTPIDITNAVQDADNASTLQPQTPNGPVIQTPPQGSSGYGPVPQQTFTSNDLSNTPGAYTPPVSTFQVTLSAMKATLLIILAHLQPFGGVGPVQPAISG